MQELIEEKSEKKQAYEDYQGIKQALDMMKEAGEGTVSISEHMLLE